MNPTEINKRKIRSREKKYIHFYRKARQVQLELERMLSPLFNFQIELVRSIYDDDEIFSIAPALSIQVLSVLKIEYGPLSIDEVLKMYKNEGVITVEMWNKHIKTEE